MLSTYKQVDQRQLTHTYLESVAEIENFDEFHHDVCEQIPLILFGKQQVLEKIDLTVRWLVRYLLLEILP